MMQNMKLGFANVFLLVTCWTVLTHSMLAAAMPAVGSSDGFGEAAIDEAKNSADALSMHKRPSFFVGSRYGRSSSPSASYAPSKTRRLSVMPRNDRFFLGSRYGKRAGEFMSPYEQGLAAAASEMTGNNNNNNNNSNNSGSAPPNQLMTCIYTGHRNLYRCNSVDEINSIINELTAAGRHNPEFDNNDVDVGIGGGVGVGAGLIEDSSNRESNK